MLIAVCLPLSGEPLAFHYQARLIQPLSIHAQPGTEFETSIVGPLSRKRKGFLPADTIVKGRVLRSDPTGLGIKREKDLLEVELYACRLPSGAEVDCEASLIAVDNARESVSRPNRIQGIPVANHPHCLMSGLWVRPTLLRVGRSGFGLTGAGGVMQSQLLTHPLASLALVIPRMIFLRLPNGDIDIPAGADFVLALKHGQYNRAERWTPIAIPEGLAQAPASIYNQQGKPAADIIQFAFSADLPTIVEAFYAAGWNGTDPLTKESFRKVYSAFSNLSGYPRAPVSPMYYEGQLPDLVFQKSLNTLGKRHHIRLWQKLIQGQEVWLGAATHDIAMKIDVRRVNFTHIVDPNIDRERNVVINDLNASQCIAGLSEVARPLWSTSHPKSIRQTDGKLAAIELKRCRSAGVHPQPQQEAPRVGAIFAGTRRVILETRNYAIRGNPYYYALKALRVYGRRPPEQADF